MELCVSIEPQLGATYDDLLTVAQMCERLGFTGFFRSDHFLPHRDDAAGVVPGGTSDAWTTLAGIARETSTIRLGTLVSSVTFRHPAVLAVQVANVDAMSAGRVELGLGTGWHAREHEAFGVPFPPHRFGRLEEALAIVTGMWSAQGSHPFDFVGEHYSLVANPGVPITAQQRLPIIIGGLGPVRTPALAAAYATEFNLLDSATLRERNETLDRASEAIGRDPSTIRRSVTAAVLAGRNEYELRLRLTRTGDHPRYLEPGRALTGTAHSIVDQLRSLEERGVHRAYLQLWDLHDLEHLELLGEEVLPHVQRDNGVTTTEPSRGD